MKQSSMDGFIREVPRGSARPDSLLPGRLPQFKFNTPQHYALTRKVFNWILKDGHHFSAVEGDGFKEMIAFIEPRFIPPGRTYLQHVCLFLCG